MIYGIGIDLVKISRIERVLKTWGERFVGRVFTVSEVIECQSRPKPASAFALRFAAKEAFSKALGTGMRRGVAWRDIETISTDGGKPELRLHGTAGRLCLELGIATAHVSLSDEGAYGSAMVVLESGSQAGGRIP
jgi:holo-[acyl-carrier protein] synthase